MRVDLGIEKADGGGGHQHSRNVQRDMLMS